MSQRLDKIISNENLAWNKTFESKEEEFFVSIDESIINQLIEKRELLKTIELSNFQFLESIISNFKKKSPYLHRLRIQGHKLNSIFNIS